MKKRNLVETTKIKDAYRNYYHKNFGNIFSEKQIIRSVNCFYRKFKKIEGLVNINKGESILEIGSGFGAVYNLLAEKGIDYKGIELDKEAVEFTKNYFSTDKFSCMSFEEYPENEKFDKIIAIEVLEHFIDPIGNIKKIRRLLKKDGIFIGTTPYPSKYTNLANDTHFFVLHPENWKKFFLMSGFSSVETYPVSLVPLMWRLSKYLSYTLPVYLPFNFIISSSLIIAKV